MNLLEKLDKLISLEGKEEEIILEITEMEETQKFITETLNNQLFETGEDGDGVSLGSYANSTIEIKKRKNQPFDRVTLKDTGFFYSTYSVKPFNGGFEISADGKVSEGVDLLVKYGENILKPNIDSLILINEYYVEKIGEYIKKEFTK